MSNNCSTITDHRIGLSYRADHMIGLSYRDTNSGSFPNGNYQHAEIGMSTTVQQVVMLLATPLASTIQHCAILPRLASKLGITVILPMGSVCTLSTGLGTLHGTTPLLQ